VVVHSYEHPNVTNKGVFITLFDIVHSMSYLCLKLVHLILKSMSHTTKHVALWCAFMVIISMILISIGHVYGISVGVWIGYLCSIASLLSMIAVTLESNPKH
jgi:hypothetical protein